MRTTRRHDPGYDPKTADGRKPSHARDPKLGGAHARTARALRAVRLAGRWPVPRAAARTEMVAPQGLLAATDTGRAASRRHVLEAVHRLDVRPGQSVLEIGTGSGFGAALLAELVGPSGHVVTMEIDAGRALDARLNLARAGFGSVDVIGGDASYGFPPEAPFDRILVRRSTPVVPMQWLEQVRPGGCAVVPVDLRGVQVLATLVRERDALRSRHLEPVHFAPLIGGPEAEGGGLRVEAGGWIARSAGFASDERGPLAALLDCTPAPQAATASLLPDSGWPFLLFLALRDRRAVLLDRADGPARDHGPAGVGLFDPEEGSLAAVVQAEGSHRLEALSFGRTDMVAALDYHVRAWLALHGPRPVLVASAPSQRDPEAGDPRRACPLAIEWHVS